MASSYTIREITGRRDMKRFIRFPLDLYRDCPQYVPALNADQLHSLTDVPSRRYCELKLWLVEDRGGKVAGRIAGMINPRYNDLYGRKRARFGWFDTIEDYRVAQMLLDAACGWARSRGMNEIHGPLYYNTMGKQGMLIEGFGNTPPFNCLYNYPYYPQFVERYGFVKELDWIQYKARANQGLPERMEQMAERLMKRYRLHVADVSELKKDKARVYDFFRNYNESFASVPNFIPYDDAEIEEESRQVMQLLSPETNCILLDEDGQVAAFGICFPSISEALKKARGRLFPFGWYHLLQAFRPKHIEVLDLMLTGNAPKYQNTGISVIVHKILADNFKRLDIDYAVTNPQVETNNAVNVWERYEHEPFMRRRCYIKNI